MLLVVANPMIVRFPLPESVTGLFKKLVGFASGESLPTLNNGAYGFIGHGPENYVDMVRHDQPGMEVVASAVEKSQSLSYEIRKSRAFQPAFSPASIEEMLELAKMISFDFFGRIIDAWIQVQAMKSLSALGPKFEQEGFRQRICKAESYKVACAFAFDVWEKATCVNARSKGIGPVRFDARGAKFKVYTVKPWVLFRGNHDRKLRQKGGKTQRFRFRGELKNRVLSNRSRSAECNSTIQQITNLRYAYINRTNFLQWFYTLHRGTRQHVNAV